jgi:hypothetical protein
MDCFGRLRPFQHSSANATSKRFDVTDVSAPTVGIERAIGWTM